MVKPEGPKTWSRHAFTMRAKFGRLLDSIVESFDFAVLPAIDKLIA